MSPSVNYSDAITRQIILDQVLRSAKPEDFIDPPPPPTLCSKTTDFFARIRRTLYYSKTARHIPIYTQATIALIKSIQSRAIHRLFQAFTEAQNDHDSSNDWMASRSFLKVAGPTRSIFAGIGGIIALYDVIAQSIELKDEIRKGRAVEGVDAALSIVKGVADLGDSIASFAMGLSMANPTQIPLSAISWAPPLAMISAVVSIASIALNYRGLTRSQQIAEQLERSAFQLRDDSEAAGALQWLRDELTDSTNRDGEFYMRRHFEVINREKYAAQVLHIIDHHELADKQELVLALQNRIKDKIFSHKLAILSAIVGLIGITIIFFPFFAPVVWGFGIVAASGLISMIKFVRDKRSVGRLEDTIDRLCSFESIAEHDDDWIKLHAPFAQPLCAPEEKEVLPAIGRCQRRKPKRRKMRVSL